MVDVCCWPQSHVSDLATSDVPVTETETNTEPQQTAGYSHNTRATIELLTSVLYCTVLSGVNMEAEVRMTIHGQR